MEMISKRIMITVGAILALSTLISCSDDNDRLDDSQNEAVGIRVEYRASVSQQLLDLATVTVRYIGANGQVTQEQMTSITWSKSVTIGLPTQAGLSIQPIQNRTVDEGEYTLAANGQMTYSWLDSNGRQVSSGGKVSTPVMEAVFNAQGIGQYLNAITGLCQVGCSFNKYLETREATIEWGGNTDDNSIQNIGLDDSGATGNSR